MTILNAAAEVTNGLGFYSESDSWDVEWVQELLALDICSTMYQNTIDILAEKNISCDCQHVTDLQQIMAFGVMSLPGLVINDKVVSYGKILSKADIEKFIDIGNN